MYGRYIWYFIPLKKLTEDDSQSINVKSLCNMCILLEICLFDHIELCLNIGKEWSYFIWFEIMNFVGLNFEVTKDLALKTNFWPAFKDNCNMVGHGFHPGLDP